MFWPVGTFIFCAYVAVGYGLGMGKTPLPTSRGLLLPRCFLSLMILALIAALFLPEISGVSPFRHFYCVVVSKDAVILRSGLWSREIPRSEIAGITYHVREFDGKKKFRYPVLRIRATSGKAWRSVEEQCIEGEPKLLRYKNIALDLKRQVVPNAN